MKKLILIVLVISLVVSVSALEIEAANARPSISRIVSLDPITSTLISFLNLIDTPSSYSGEGGNCVAVNVGESGLEFISCGGGGITDTNASTECSGTTTYLDGEGNCDDISSVYVNLTGDTMSGNLVVQHATGPTVATVDTTNTVGTLIQSGNTRGLVGTSTNHEFEILTNSLVAAMIDTNQQWNFTNNITVNGLFKNSTDSYTFQDFLIDTNVSSICSDNEVLLGQDTVTCVSLNDTIDDLFSGKTTDDLTEGSTNKYDNQSWNQSFAEGLFSNVTLDNVAFINETQEFTQTQNFSQNVSIGDTLCFNADCSSRIFWNGTALIGVG